MSITEAGRSLLVPGTSVVATAIPSNGATVTSVAAPVTSSVAVAAVSTAASVPASSSVAGGTALAGKYFKVNEVASTLVKWWVCSVT